MKTDLLELRRRLRREVGFNLLRRPAFGVICSNVHYDFSNRGGKETQKLRTFFQNVRHCGSRKAAGDCIKITKMFDKLMRVVGEKRG